MGRGNFVTHGLGNCTLRAVRVVALSVRLLRYGYYCIIIVSRLDTITLAVSAGLTLVYQNSLPRFCLYGVWWHEPATVGSAVTGVNIYMLAPEATRTVVGVAIPLYPLTAMLASKVFFESFKRGGHIVSSGYTSKATSSFRSFTLIADSENRPVI